MCQLQIRAIANAMANGARDAGKRLVDPADSSAACVLQRCSAMSSKVRTGFPIDEAMRAEHGEGVVRPVPDIFDDYDPADPSDRGPHVDRVGLVAVDTDSAADDNEDDDPTPEAPAD